MSQTPVILNSHPLLYMVFEETERKKYMGENGLCADLVVYDNTSNFGEGLRMPTNGMLGGTGQYMLFKPTKELHYKIMNDKYETINIQSPFTIILKATTGCERVVVED